MICQKIGKRVEGKTAVGVCCCENIIPDPFYAAAKSPGVIPTSESKIVIDLNRSPVKMIASGRP